MSKYFRITGYNEKENISVIMDSNGKFNEIWEFSVYMLQKGFRIKKIGRIAYIPSPFVSSGPLDKIP